jgi:hypothetical protein
MPVPFGSGHRVSDVGVWPVSADRDELRSVQIGAGNATLTVDVNEYRQPARVEYGNVAGAAGTGSAGGDLGALARLFAVPVLGGGLLKLASMLSRLGDG